MGMVFGDVGRGSRERLGFWGRAHQTLSFSCLGKEKNHKVRRLKNASLLGLIAVVEEPPY